MTSSYPKNKVVLITGGTKGLGLVLAEHLLNKSCKVAICAREEEELNQAKNHLLKCGGDIFTYKCDVAVRKEVNDLLAAVINHYGELDIIINNAGIIIVGPMESFDFHHYEDAMNVMFWGIANTTLSIVPYFKGRQNGHIVNITSVGAKVSIPHLLPYNAAKFAAAGFSEGSAAELRKDNIYVTTVYPGLMRTGSYVNAFFQKENKKEFKLFAFMSTAPLLTISADKAARRIVKAIEQKELTKVVGLPAKVLIELNHFFPRIMNRIFSMVARSIPSSETKTGFEKGINISHQPDSEIPGFREIGKKIRSDHQGPSINQ
ncbi:MAG: SDR family NAD(P)-dependent oxidoreductase [Bacteriovoracia bacterium]